MPAVYAHYVFGKKVYEKLPKREKQIICKKKDAFLLGLHGPDLLFYYYPIKENRIIRQGVAMHKEIAADFFEKGRICYYKGQDMALRAYLYGFLCHFMLDSECHPYVNQYMEENDLGHLEIETEFDRYLMEADGYDPLEYVPVHHLISRRHTRKQISRMLEHVTPRQIGVCIHQFRLVIAFSICKNPVKKRFLKTLSRITGQDKNVGGLIMDGRVHPCCSRSNQFLEERLKQTVVPTVEEIRKYSKILDDGGYLSMRLHQDYEGMSRKV